MLVPTSAEFVGFLYGAVFFLSFTSLFLQFHIYYCMGVFSIYCSLPSMIVVCTTYWCHVIWICLSPVPLGVCSWWTWVKLYPSSQRTHSFPRDPKKELHNVQEAVVIPHFVHLCLSECFSSSCSENLPSLSNPASPAI